METPPNDEVSSPPLSPPKKQYKPLNKRKVNQSTQIRMDKAARLMISKGLTAPQALMKAGYSPMTASHHSSEITARPYFQERKGRILAELERQDPLLFANVAKTLKKGLRAKKAIVVANQIEFVPDTAERRKHAEDIARLAGEMGEGKNLDQGGAVNFNLMLQLVQKAEEERQI